MNKENLNGVLKAITKKTDYINKLPIPTPDVLSFVKNLCDAYGENQKTTREIARVEATERILSQEIKSRYGFYYHLFDKIFEERRAGILKSFEIIDLGISQNKENLIINGLKSLGQIVSSSPFADIDKLRNLLESDEVIDI